VQRGRAAAFAGPRVQASAIDRVESMNVFENPALGHVAIEGHTRPKPAIQTL